MSDLQNEIQQRMASETVQALDDILTAESEEYSSEALNKLGDMRKTDKKKRHRWLWLWLLLIPVIAAAAVACYFFVFPYVLPGFRSAAVVDKSATERIEPIKSRIDQIAEADTARVLEAVGKQRDYASAKKLLEEGKFYEAYKAFVALADFQDAADLAKTCIQPKPKTGVIARDEKFKAEEIEISINNKEDKTNNIYLKIYEGESETVALRAFIAGGEELSFKIPPGTYTIKEAMGSGNWYGETDMFGDEGAYGIVNSGPVNIEPGYAYTLGAASEGKGAAVTDRDNF